MRQRAWFLASLPTAVALAGLLAPSSAAALNRFVAIDAQHIDYHDITSDSIELQQRIDSPTPGPATQTVSGSNWLSTGSIDFGAAGHAYTSGNLTSTASGSHSIHNGIVESFEDYLNINTGTPGQTGTATFLIHLDGTLVASGGGSAYVYFTSSGTSAYSLTTESGGQGYPHGSPVNLAVDQWLTFTTAFTSGVNAAINGGFTVGADLFFNGPGSGSAVADFSHTLQWGGLQTVITSSGVDVTKTTTITSGSGFDYSAPIPPTGAPEPATWAMLLTGFGGLGAALRRGRGAQRRLA